MGRAGLARPGFHHLENATRKVVHRERLSKHERIVDRHEYFLRTFIDMSGDEQDRQIAASFPDGLCDLWTGTARESHVGDEQVESVL